MVLQRVEQHHQGTGGNNGYAIITNQGSAPSLSGGGTLNQVEL